MAETRRKILVVLALLLVVASFGCGCIEESAEYQTYINDEYKFKVSYPEGWGKRDEEPIYDNEIAKVRFSVQNYTEEGKAECSVTIRTDTKHTNIYLSRNWSEEDKEEWGVKIRKITVNGREGEEVFMKDAGGWKATIREVVIPAGELYYDIHCQCTADNYTDYADIFDYIINSLEIAEEAELITAPTPMPPEPQKVEITLDIPKTSLSVGEKFGGKYFVESSLKGTVFIIENWKKEGYEAKYRPKGVVASPCKHTGGFKACEACEVTEPEYGWYNDRESFETPGTYIYEVEVYDCAQIREILGVDSVGDAKGIDIVTQVPPFNATKEIVTVTEK